MVGYDLKNIFWRERHLVYNEGSEPAAGERFKKIYRVLGFTNYGKHEPIPIRLQKNCRAFLRGTKKQTGIRGLDKIIFDK